MDRPFVVVPREPLEISGGEDHDGEAETGEMEWDF